MSLNVKENKEFLYVGSEAPVEGGRFLVTPVGPTRGQTDVV